MQMSLSDFIDQHFPDADANLRAYIDEALNCWLDNQRSNKPYYERHIYKLKEMDAHIERGEKLLDELVEWFECFPDGMRQGLNVKAALNSDRGLDELLVGAIEQARRLRNSMRGETPGNPSDNLFNWLRGQNNPMGKTMIQSGEKARHWNAVRVLNHVWERSHGPIPQYYVNRFRTDEARKLPYIVYLEGGLKMAGINNNLSDVLANYRKLLKVAD